jgi:hypothetical protein
MDMEREEGHFDAASGHYVEDKFKVSQRGASFYIYIYMYIHVYMYV